MYGARVVIPSKWNVTLLLQLATSISDREVVQFLMFGWPLNHDGRPMSCTFQNHKSATLFPEHIYKYLMKEIQYGSLLGPFITAPWTDNIVVSPMSTTSKKGTSDRRIIMDMSWPHDGTSVNDGIPKDVYMGQPINLVYPTVDHLCKHASDIGFSCRGYRRDMKRAFKQVLGDPFTWGLMGITWAGMLFF